MRVIVVGGGLAGLMAALRLAEQGLTVDLFSSCPVRRSHSVCAQGGINAAVNTKGEGDSPQNHFEETLHGGDYLANQPQVRAMCEAGPSIIYLLDRMGVAFNRTAEGLIDFRRFGGTLFHRTAFAGATTGQQMMYALDEQVRRFEHDGLVKKYEGWSFLSAVLDGSRVARGIVAMDHTSMKVEAFRADAVIMATGGPGAVFGRTTNSMTCTGSAAGALFEQGIWYANGEFIQVHPTAIPGADKCRLISESVRAEGGRVWVPRDGKKWYFLEEWFPSYGNLVPRDIATRAIFKVVHEMGLGVDGNPMVYLDVTHIPAETLDRKLAGVIEIYEKFVGEDPRRVPMKVFPAVHYSMGGIYVDAQQMTNVPGLLAAGECEYQYHGANRLGANSLLSCVYGGRVAADTAARYVRGLETRAEAAEARLFEEERKRQEGVNEKLLHQNGKENLFELREELGEWMTKHMTVIRHNADLARTLKKIDELTQRCRSVRLADQSEWMNQSLAAAREFWNMLTLARVMTAGALQRDESRGAHFKPAFPERDDVKFLKSTVAEHTPTGAKFFWEEVDTSLVKPKPRKYDMKQQAQAAAHAT